VDDVHDGYPDTSVNARTATLQAFLDHYFRRRPVNATFTGMHAFDHHLPDWSREGVSALQGEMQALRRRIAEHRIPSPGDAPGGQPDPAGEHDWVAIDLALADSFLELQLAELEGRHFQRGNPSLVIGEVAFGIISLLTREFAPPSERAEAIGARLRQVPGFLSAALEILREGAVPGAWAAKAAVECQGTLAVLGSGIETWCQAAGLQATQASRLGVEARSAAAHVAAFANGLDVMDRDDDAGPCGRGFLERVVARGHWCQRSLDQLHADASAAFAIERRRLDEMARAVDPGGWLAIQERLASTHPAAEEYYPTFGRTWAACRARAEEYDLVTWPDAPIRYVPIPSTTRDAAPLLYYLYYRSPAPLEWPALHDYVVTPIEGLGGEALVRHHRTWNHGVIKLNHVVHHGGIGHHVQNWHAARSPLQLGRIAAVDCASRIGMFLGGSLAEGWACYATQLMEECGFLTADEQVSEQHTRVRMLARALVDLEFHTGGRSFGAAVDFYVGEVGMSPAVARAEVVKNSMFPGTALMYWLGTSQLLELRESERARRGSDFSLRRFHDAVLSFGAIPVALLARLLTSGHAPVDSSRRGSATASPRDPIAGRSPRADS